MGAPHDRAAATSAAETDASTDGSLRARFDANHRRELRSLARDAAILARRALVPERARLTPSFIILGAQKSGTTALFRYLAQHPKVVAPIRKEVHYFSANYAKGRAWYLAHFPRDRGDGATSGEGSPYYLYHPHCAERIRESFPDARLLVLLRNPIDRAMSQHGHERRQGGERRSMRDAFAQERARVEPEERRLLAEPYADSRVHRRESFLSRGIYAPQLARYFEHFPREQLLVQRYERFFAEPERHFAEVLEHLGLPHVDVAFDRIGGGDGRDRRDVDRDALAAFFQPHNEALSDLLGEDFTDWR